MHKPHPPLKKRLTQRHLSSLSSNSNTTGNSINMAHRPNQRRSSAAPEPNSSPHPLDITLKKSPKQTITTHPTTQTSDPLIASEKPFFMSNHFSRLNLNHKTRAPSKPTDIHHNRDIRLQAKALTVSADADSSKFSLIKATHRLAHEKAKESLKDTFRKASKDLGGKNQQQQRSVLDSKKLSLTTVKEKQLKILHEGHDGDVDMNKASASLSRRRSLSDSKVELSSVLANCGVIIVSVDMPPFMQIHAVDCARKTHDSLEKFTSKALALTLKKFTSDIIEQLSYVYARV
ncbi:Dynein light chain type 1 family protein, putative isoform 2 [Hibiscus syriacus]|uniref:Dynein light chain type 1 family protein, putative isoform 2 n=1 Tax=Hibiscus syriacus TaxID=106335 RepID=A0A6A3BG55_HIBSY|nr:Dynein light chain type 1 family protein, putative isoform 2 [Hibiscus syriacus]